MPLLELLMSSLTMKTSDDQRQQDKVGDNANSILHKTHCSTENIICRNSISPFLNSLIFQVSTVKEITDEADVPCQSSVSLVVTFLYRFYILLPASMPEKAL